MLHSGRIQIVRDVKFRTCLGEWPNPFGDQVDGVVALLQDALDDDKGLAAHDVAAFAIQIREHDDIEQAMLILQQEEGDSLGGTRPLPADDESRDLDAGAIRDVERLGYGADSARQAGTEQAERVIAGRESHESVVTGHLLPGAHWAQRDHILLNGQRDGELAPRCLAVFAAEGARGQEQTELPERLTATETEAIGRADGDQVFGGFDAQRNPAHDVGERREWATSVTFGDEAGSDLLAGLRDISQTDTDRVAMDRALHPALVDIGRQNANLVPSGVVSQNVRRVKPHRLIVQQRADKFGRVVVLEP